MYFQFCRVDMKSKVSFIFRWGVCRPLDSLDDLFGCWVRQWRGSWWAERRIRVDHSLPLQRLREREKGEGDGRTGRLLSLKHIHTDAHLIIFSSINGHSLAEEGRSRRSRRWVWTSPSLSFIYLLKIGIAPPTPYPRCLQHENNGAVDVWSRCIFFLRDNILVMQPDWVATRCKTQPSNVDAQLTPFVAFPF